jgi:cytoplasmic iron level regulating protein YaaA (DUF328/UPF0246 family)
VRRIALVSCVKSKRSVPAAARELYTSPLFRGLRDYAEATTDAWYILSAKYGILSPDDVVAPYELTLNRMLKSEREAWARRVQDQIVDLIAPDDHITLLAGARYREQLEPFLRGRGNAVVVPLEGLPMGHQLAWLKRYRKDRDAC